MAGDGTGIINQNLRAEAFSPQCRHSRFNTRKTREPEEIERLAKRIQQNGFERTRAPWAVQVDGHYEIFAGGTRLEAAKLLDLDDISLMLHVGLTDEEVSKLTEVDNENDEYHKPVSPVDVWAEYARLRDEEGWKQERIAKAKGIDRSMVSFRQKLYGLPDYIKNFVNQGWLTETHLIQITQLLIDSHFSPWLTSEQAWLELAEIAVHGRGEP